MLSMCIIFRKIVDKSCLFCYYINQREFLSESYYCLVVSSEPILAGGDFMGDIKGGDDTMRNYLMVLLFLACGLSSAFGIGGDMGVGSEPFSDGSFSRPYLIEDINDFEVFSSDPNFWSAGVHTHLKSNIDLGGIDYSRAVISPDNDKLLRGFDGVSFSGVFNGGGYAISNLTIDARSEGNNYLGLFGNISNYGEVSDLGIIHINIIADSELYWFDHIGGLCGENFGYIHDCYSTGMITGDETVGGLCGDNYGYIMDSYSLVSVEGEENIGGFCAGNFGVIRGSYFSGFVYGCENIGGFCGTNYSFISGCYTSGQVTGSVSGGFCGSNCGNIFSCYSGASVVGVDWAENVGGFCGQNEEGFISNCYSIGSVHTGYSASNVGGFCGRNWYLSSIAKCYSSGVIFVGSGAVGVEGFCGINEGLSDIASCFWDVYTSGIGTEGQNNYGATGEATGHMQQAITFTDQGWDFSGGYHSWVVKEDGYPEFLWQQSIAYMGDVQAYLLPNESCVLEIDVFSVLDETLAWSIEGYESCGWITNVTPNFGSSSGPTDKTRVSIYVDSTGLSMDNYTCVLTLTPDEGDAVIISVELNVTLSGSGTSSDPFLIQSLGDFNAFSDPVNSDMYWASGAHCKLVCDIDLGGKIFEHAVISPDFPDVNENYNGIPFKGVFDGDGHVIRNMTITPTLPEKGFLGLFGIIEGVDAEVKDLGLENITITSSGVMIYSGGLCGFNGDMFGGTSGGSIHNCYVTGSMTAGSMGQFIGGVCGLNVSGNISDCYSTVSVNCIEEGFALGSFCSYNISGTISNCYSTGAVTGAVSAAYSGGFCGANAGFIDNCYSMGNLICGNNSMIIGGFCGYHIGGIISNCYSAGAVSNESNPDNVWGFCGMVESGSMSNSFWDISKCGKTTGYYLEPSGGGTATNVVGKTTSLMQTESTFTDAGWDFVGTWWVNEARDYPKLFWQPFGDMNGDNRVDMGDIAVMGLAWLSSEGDLDYNPVYELSGDTSIDEADLAELVSSWLAGI